MDFFFQGFVFFTSSFAAIKTIYSAYLLSAFVDNFSENKIYERNISTQVNRTVKKEVQKE